MASSAAALLSKLQSDSSAGRRGGLGANRRKKKNPRKHFLCVVPQEEQGNPMPGTGRTPKTKHGAAAAAAAAVFVYPPGTLEELWKTLDASPLIRENWAPKWIADTHG
ncbi:unnamed protein product [Ixodes pacificus]